MKRARRFEIVYNPRSGGGRGRAIADRLARQMRSRGHEVTATGTDRAGQVWRTLRVDALDALVVIGGDGTLNEAINGLGDLRVPIAFFAAGTANVARRELRLPRGAAGFARLLDDARAVDVPVSVAGNRRWLLFAECGYHADGVVAANDAWAASERPRTLERLRKMGRIAWGALRAVCSSRATFRATVDGEPLEDLTNLLVYRNRYYGGALFLPGPVGIEDARFRVLATRTTSTFVRLSIVACALARVLGVVAPYFERRGALLQRHGRTVEISAPQRGSTACHVDAESHAPPPLSIRMLPAERMRLIVGPRFRTVLPG